MLAVVAGSLALVLSLQPVVADTVIVQNGDRITGEVIRQKGGELVIRTDYAGTIRLDWAKVRAVRLDEPAPVLLDDDRVVDIVQITRDKQSVRLDTAAASEPIRVSPDAIRAVDPDPWEMGKGGKLSGRVGLALEDKSGNSESTELDIDLTLRYRRRWSELETFGQLEYNTTRGRRSQDKWNLNNKYTRYFPRTPWYGAGWLRLKKDRFADVRLRTITGPAIGYGFQPHDGGTLSVELGPAYVDEDYYTNPDQSYWGPGLFFDYEQPFSGDRVELYLHGMAFRSLSDQRKELWVARTGLRVPVAPGFFGGVEYEIDHDDPPALQAGPTDETVKLKLGYEW